MKCGFFKQVFVADAGTWEQNLNSPVGHSDCGEAGGTDEQPTCKDERTPPHRDASERGGAGCVHEGLSPHDAQTIAWCKKVSCHGRNRHVIERYDANLRQTPYRDSQLSAFAHGWFSVCGPRTEVRSSRSGADAYRTRSRARRSRAIENISPQF